ncbi:MAG TPA: winged helix-turn-helix domain-containing protein [Ktedonobacterales bacterium]|nr:winged helix-turn-helix domain-containing protein [Ktedonobacterales bacterium]
MLVENPYSAMTSRYMRNRFYGREELVGAITNGITAPEPRSYAILGTPKIGKTTLLWYLRDEQGAFRAPQYASSIAEDYRLGGSRRLLFVYIPFRNEHQPHILEMLLKHLRLAIDEQNEKHRSANGGKPVIAYDPNGNRQAAQLRPLTATLSNADMTAQLLGDLKYALDRLEEQRWRVVFLLDDFGDALDPGSTQGSNLISVSTGFSEERAMLSLANRAAFVITLDHDRSADLDSNFLLSLRINELGLLDNKAAMALIEEPAKELTHDHKHHITQKEANYLVWLAGHQPFLLALVCAEYLAYREQYSSAMLMSTLANPLSQTAEHREYKHLTNYLLSKTQINLMLKLLWEDAVLPEERELLYLIATAREEEKEDDITRRFKLRPNQNAHVINALREKSLVFIEGGKPRVFGHLFREYVRGAYQQAMRRDQPSLEEMRKHIAGTLGPLDQEVFERLTSRQGDVYLYEELREHVWKNPATPQHTVNASINRIRRVLDKLDSSGRVYIENERNRGYSLKLS